MDPPLLLTGSDYSDVVVPEVSIYSQESIYNYENVPIGTLRCQIRRVNSHSQPGTIRTNGFGFTMITLGTIGSSLKAMFQNIDVDLCHDECCVNLKQFHGITLIGF